MKMARIKTNGTSTIKIRNLAMLLRKILGLGINDAPSAAKLFEKLFFIFGEHGYDYQIIPDDDQRLGLCEEAKTDITTGKIYVKESVYKSASTEMFTRAAFTLMHEDGHFLIHRLQGFSLSRVSDKAEIKTYEDPEWQANTFAAEFLMPYEGCKGLTAEEIKEKYKVTISAAKSRFRNINKK